MSTLTRDQADLLIRYGAGWVLGDIIRNPDAGISAAKESRSGAATHEWWWDTDEKGIRASRYVPGDAPRAERQPRHVELTWTQIRRAVAAMPPKLVFAVVDASKEHRRQINHRVPPYLAGGYAPFVYPDPEWEAGSLRSLKGLTIEAIESLVDGELALFAVSA